MRGRVGAFFFGFALGALSLAVLLQATGSLRKTQAAAPRPAVPQGTAERRQDAPPPPPPDVQGPRIGVPLAGLDPKDIHDTFGEARDGRRHEAADIMAPLGTPVEAVAEGNVAKLFTSKAGGLTVYQYDNKREWCFYYAHLDRYAAGLQENTLLRKGDVLGYVGNTGNAAGGPPHLHFALFRLGPEQHWWQGTPVNPYPLLVNAARNLLR